MNDPFEQTLRARLADLTASRSTDPESRLQAIDYNSLTATRNRLWAAGTVCSAAVAAGVVAVILLLSSGGSARLAPLNGTSYSLAGWASVPTTSGSKLLRSGIKACDHSTASFVYSVALRDRHPKDKTFGFTLLKTAIASVENVLTDVRGKYVAVVSLDHDASFVCINGDRAGQGGSNFRDPSIPVAAAPGLLSSARVVHLAGSTYVDGRKVTGLGAGDHAYGRAGKGVSAVLFSFASGRTVDATVENGWYFAWWPWRSAPTSVQVTNTAGTFRSATNCTPGSSGCVLSAEQ